MGSLEGLITAGLYLHDCSLRRLRVEVLAPLNVTLRNLWVNGNDIERIDRLVTPLLCIYYRPHAASPGLIEYTRSVS